MILGEQRAGAAINLAAPGYAPLWRVASSQLLRDRVDDRLPPGVSRRRLSSRCAGSGSRPGSRPMRHAQLRWVAFAACLTVPLPPALRDGKPPSRGRARGSSRAGGATRSRSCTKTPQLRSVASANRLRLHFRTPCSTTSRHHDASPVRSWVGAMIALCPSPLCSTVITAGFSSVAGLAVSSEAKRSPPTVVAPWE
jgi:hypothetical protein